MWEAEDAPALRDYALRTGNAFLLVYSIADRRSFDHIRELYELILEKASATKKDRVGGASVHVVVPPVMIVGNKTDLDAAAQREVTF